MNNKLLTVEVVACQAHSAGSFEARRGIQYGEQGRVQLKAV